MVHPGRHDPARAGAAGTLRTRRDRAGTAPGPQSRRRVPGADTSVTQLVLRLNYHPGHTRVVNAAFWHARNTAAGGETGPFIRHQGGCGVARLLRALGMRDAAGAAAVDARGSVPLVPVAARTRRGAAGAAGARAAGRARGVLLGAGWRPPPAGGRRGGGGRGPRAGTG